MCPGEETDRDEYSGRDDSSENTNPYVPGHILRHFGLYVLLTLWKF